MIIHLKLSGEREKFLQRKCPKGSAISRPAYLKTLIDRDMHETI